MKFTACYTKLEHGYMGKILEWPGVITEGDDLEDCEEMLKDAARVMALTYYEDGKKIPQETLIVKPIDIPLTVNELCKDAGIPPYFREDIHNS